MKSIEELAIECGATKRWAWGEPPIEYLLNLQQLQAFAEAYHQAKMAELEPVAWTWYYVGGKHKLNTIKQVSLGNECPFDLNVINKSIEMGQEQIVKEIKPLYTLPSKG